MVDRQTPADIEISKIVIRKQSGTEMQIIPAPEENNVMEELFVNMSIHESIFQSGINGNIRFKEPGVVGDYFNIIGNEFIDIEFESPDIKDSHHKLTFCINDVRYLGDEASDSLAGPAARSGAGWELEFVSCENFFLDWDNLDYMNEDFIGKIAGGDGLVDELATKYFNPGSTEFSFAQEKMEPEETHNSIWLKKNQSMYPWGKDTHPPNLNQLLNNLAENSVTKDLKGVNYLFYADFKGWHFKSVRKMIKDADTWFFGLFGGPREYIITDIDVPPEEWNDGEGHPRIISHRMISEYDHLSLWKNGAYSSYYELIKPNYEDPYFDYIDYTTQHQNIEGESWGENEIIDYDYHRDADEWGEPDVGGRIEKYKLLPEVIDTSIEIDDAKNIDKKSRRKYDESGLYGYFESPMNYPNEKPYDFFGSYATNGKQGKQNDKVWQTMFDQTNLEGKIIKTIQKEIKDPIRKKYTEHVTMMNLKEKFNVYRHSICCDKQSVKPFVFLALIHDARKIQDNPRGGVYEYSWKEVEMWPRDFVEGITGEDVPIHDQSPLRIVIPEEGISGTIREEGDDEYSEPAFNINELMNYTEGDNVYVGPGVNVANEDFNDYPEAYQMMPVGGYFDVVNGALVDPCELQDDDGNGIEDGPWKYGEDRGHIVQMYRIPDYVLNGISPTESDPNEEPDPTIPTDVYFFDVPNAHDGLCGCVS